jgi:hypothetical protein
VDLTPSGLLRTSRRATLWFLSLTSELSSSPTALLLQAVQQSLQAAAMLRTSTSSPSRVRLLLRLPSLEVPSLLSTNRILSFSRLQVGGAGSFD